MNDETNCISSKTWTKAVQNINKMGYSDGVVDGQSTTFQSSFDTGYEQGFIFGLRLGHAQAKKQQHESHARPENIRNINCQICFSGGLTNQNVVNIYNTQKENNDMYLKTAQST